VPALVVRGVLLRRQEQAAFSQPKVVNVHSSALSVCQWVRALIGNKWLSGVVNGVCAEPNSYVVKLSDGRLFRRTRYCQDFPAAQGAAGTPVVVVMRSVFTKEFLQDSYAGYQENKLRNRKQGANEPAAEYYYEVMNLCRLMDPNMTEAAKIHHLYQGLKRTLVERYGSSNRRPVQFLATIRRHTEAADIAQNQGWAVHTLAADKEEARVAAIGREQ
jgi:hypothetical protein